MFERILLMGPPGSGKSKQLITVIELLQESKTPIYVIDLEDKLEATLLGLKLNPPNMKLYTTFEWDEEPSGGLFGGFRQIAESITSVTNPGDWIAVDRVDLCWPMVQRWFTKRKYDEELAERMLQKSIDMKKASMFTPRFDQGGWQVINEQYDSQIMKLFYKSRCNILLTTGIKGITDDNPLDIGRLGVLPRGQKEIGHQPHSLFLLGQQRVRGREWSWVITTDKDLPGRDYFDKEEIFDFSLQYLGLHYSPEVK